MLRMRGYFASGRRSPREWLPALILALLLCSSASVDVVIKEKSVSEGLGGLGNRAAKDAEKKTGEMSSSGTASGGPLMKVVTEVISITISPAPAGSLDVPAGYKLQKKE